MIKCNHYKFNDYEFLVYGEKFDFPENFELLTEDIDPSLPGYRDLDLISIDSVFAFKRTRDKVLEEEHIKSFNDLSNAYMLLRMKELNKPKRVRDFVEQKYIEVIELVQVEDEMQLDRETNSQTSN